MAAHWWRGKGSRFWGKTHDAKEDWMKPAKGVGKRGGGKMPKHVKKWGKMNGGGKRGQGEGQNSGGSEGVTWSKVRLPARALARAHPTLQFDPLFFRQSSSLHHPHHFLSIIPSALNPNLYYPPSPSSPRDFIHSFPPLLTCMPV